MFKKTFIGDYIWEITPRITLQYMDGKYSSIFDGFPLTHIYIDEVSYPLKGDFRKQFEETGGDLQKIKQVYLDNIEHTKFNVPKGESYGPMMKIFIEHIDKHIK